MIAEVPANPTRLAIIGDVGGHLLPLVEQLVALGVDVDARRIPSDLVICQVGDLVHKGPDSDAVVRLVGEYLQVNTGQWVQLVGNHESQYLPGGTEFWPSTVSETSRRALLDWWGSGQLRIAASFSIAGPTPDAGPDPGAEPDEGPRVDSCPAGQLLVTHAGLTAGAWRLLGEPATVTEAVELLNRAEAPVVWRQGGMTTGAVDLAAGPIWARAVREVYASWALYDQSELAREEPAPPPVFPQAHGHTTAFHWRRRRWRLAFDELPRLTEPSRLADERRKITRIRIGQRVYFGTDPDAGVAPASVSVPLVLPLAQPLVQSGAQPQA